MSFINGYTFDRERFFSFTPDPIIEGIQTSDDTEKNRNILSYVDSEANNNYNEIDKNIQDYNDLRVDLNKRSEFNTAYIPDKTDLVRTTNDVRKQDINSLLLQQNYIFIVGSITCATLLIGAIVIGKGK
jgi:hypothetical protein